MLVVSLLPLILMGIISFTAVESTTKKTTFHVMTTLTNEIGNEVWRALNAGYRNILLLAQNPIIRSSESSHLEQEQELIKTHDFHQIFKDITLLNLEGNVRASVHYSFIGSYFGGLTPHKLKICCNNRKKGGIIRLNFMN